MHVTRSLTEMSKFFDLVEAILFLRERVLADVICYVIKRLYSHVCIPIFSPHTKCKHVGLTHLSIVFSFLNVRARSAF